MIVDRPTDPIVAPAKDPNYQSTRTIIILLSDGLNTQDRWYMATAALNTSMRGKSLLVRQHQRPDAIKKDTITIYTIQVNTNGDPTSTVLKGCATDGNFQIITAGKPARDAFANILAQIAKLRIAQVRRVTEPTKKPGRNGRAFSFGEIGS